MAALAVVFIPGGGAGASSVAPAVVGTLPAAHQPTGGASALPVTATVERTGSLAVAAAPCEASLCPWPHRTIYLEDHTGTLWPVTSAPRMWNTGTHLRLTYGRCRSGYPCIRYYEGTFAPGVRGCPGDWVGCTIYFSNGRYTTAATIWFNNRWGRVNSAAQHNQTVCHETGHALGLWRNHEYTGNPRLSCMYYLVLGLAQRPGTFDLTAINSAYRRIPL